MELGPGAVLVNFALIHVEHCGKTSDYGSNLRTPSKKLRVEYKYASLECPNIWCQRMYSISARILMIEIAWIINS